MTAYDSSQQMCSEQGWRNVPTAVICNAYISMSSLFVCVNETSVISDMNQQTAPNPQAVWAPCWQAIRFESSWIAN